MNNNKIVFNGIIFSPILVSLLSLFVRDGFFYVNLVTVPILFIVVFFARYKYDAVFAIGVIATSFVIIFIYFEMSGDARKTLYLGFEIMALLVLADGPEFFEKEFKIDLLGVYDLASKVYILLYAVLMIDPSRWIDGRYTGALNNTNLSVYYLMYFLLFQYLKVSSENNFPKLITGFILFLIGSIFAYVASESRSIVFFIIPAGYIFIKNLLIKKKGSGYFLIIAVLTLVFLSGWHWGNIFERFDSDETSFQTRAEISSNLIDEVISSHGKPNGPRYAVDYVVYYTGNIDMHPHNDILSGIIDYGVLFLVMLFIFIGNLFAVNRVNIFNIACFATFISSALHGYLFGLSLFLPLMITLRYYRILSSDRDGVLRNFQKKIWRQ